jgi:TRAP-type C4-dicarboxylate transport system permease small subunit
MEDGKAIDCTGSIPFAICHPPYTQALSGGVVMRATGVVAVILFALLTAVVTLQVVNRLVLHQSFIWSEEIARFLFFWVVLLGAAISVRRRRHFVVDVTPASWRGGGGLRHFLFDVTPHLCILAFAVFLLVQAIVYAREGTLRTASNSGVNMAIVYGAIPVFAALAVAWSVMNLLADYRAFRAGPPPDRLPPPAE